MIEKILERLEEKKSHYLHDELTLFELGKSNGANYCSGKAKGIGIAIQIVQEVANEHGDGWIPCSERLPEEATSYQVTEEVVVNSTKQYIVDIRLFGTEGEWLCPSNRKIIAWQSLPAPYQKGE